ncbi:MAG: hypothetical protein GX271_06540 [Clostridiales bacterium]|nr:hypothetical protein [Clostridiales bacterium]
MNLLMALLGTLMLYGLQNYAYKRLWSKGLKVDLRFSKEAVIEGDEVSLIETISNHKLIIQKKLMDTTANDYLIVISYNQKEELQQLMLDQIRVKREFTWVIPTNKDIKVRVSEEILDHIIEWELNE